MKVLVSILTTIVCISSLHSQYSVDSTFNLTGSNEFTWYAGNIVNGEKLAYTEDNSVIVAGRWINQLTVWKYLQNGDLDPSFGQNGYTAIDIPGSTYTYVRDVSIQSDGKIVVLANRIVYASNFDYTISSIVLARFLADGTPDVTFNTTGVLITRPDPNFVYNSFCLEIDKSDHSVYVGGMAVEYGSYSCGSGVGQWFIAKFTEDGVYNTSFNTTGFIQQTSSNIVQTYTTVTPIGFVHDLKVREDGKLIAAGSLNLQDSCLFTMRFENNGTYDNSYGLNGRNAQKILAYNVIGGEATHVKILDDESTVFSTEYGLISSSGQQDSMQMNVFKVNSLGNPDLTFGSAGYLTCGQKAIRVSLAVDPQNNLVYTWYNKEVPVGSQSVYFRRFTENGIPDPSFGNNGYYEHEPIANDMYMGESTMRDICFSEDGTDMTLLAFRSANYVPTTFRVINYKIDTTAANNLGIATSSNNTEIQLYPNPSEGAFTVKFEGITEDLLTLQVTDLNGNLVFSELLQGIHESDTRTFDISAVQSGLYFVEVHGANGISYTTRIVKQ